MACIETRALSCLALAAFVPFGSASLKVTMAATIGDAFLNTLVSAEEIQERVNERFDALFHVDTNGKCHPFVCAICDEFLLTKEEICPTTLAKLKKSSKVLSWTNMKDPRRTKEIEDYFTVDWSSSGCKEDLSFLKGMALSPRSVIYTKNATKKTN